MGRRRHVAACGPTRSRTHTLDSPAIIYDVSGGRRNSNRMRTTESKGAFSAAMVPVSEVGNSDATPYGLRITVTHAKDVTPYRSFDSGMDSGAGPKS